MAPALLVSFCDWMRQQRGTCDATLSLGKQFKVTEHKWFELRGDAFNLANTPVFNSPRTITSAVFGEISSATAERNVQLVAKFRF